MFASLTCHLTHSSNRLSSSFPKSICGSSILRRSLFGATAPKSPKFAVLSKIVDPLSAKVVFYAEEDAHAVGRTYSLPKAVVDEMNGKLGTITSFYPENLNYRSKKEHTDASSSSNISSVLHGSEVVASREIFVGLGKKSQILPSSISTAVSKAVGSLKARKLQSATFVIPGDIDAPPQLFGKPQIASNAGHRISQSELVSTFTSEILNGYYKFDKYITNDQQKAVPLEKIQFLVGFDHEVAPLQLAADRAAIISRAQSLAKTLTNERAEVANPAWYEKQAFEFTQHHTAVTMETIHAADLKGLGLNLLMAVGQGATCEPRLVLLHYNGNPNSDEKIALVGKGITFDTGGLNLKSTGYIEDMYIDNAGAAACLATLQAAVELGIKRNIVVAMCLAENAIGPKAFLPSAIIKSYKGLSVEIGNTDAEGRLVLADGLTYVQKHHKPTHIIDLATLTGACVVGLGESAAGLFTNDDAFCASVRAAGDSVGEIAWPLPILPEHIEGLKGTESDLRNITKSKYGGACSAAAFLKEFIEPDTKWCHLDIAGPAKHRKEATATGFGVKLLVQWLLSSTNSHL